MIKRTIICIATILTLSASGVSAPLKDKLLAAIIQTESRYDAGAVLPSENAVGILQIRPIMIEDVNRILIYKKDSRRYTLEDRINPKKSIEIWYIVQRYYNPTYDLRTACLVWNGRGKDGQGDKNYLAKIQSLYDGGLIQKTFTAAVSRHNPDQPIILRSYRSIDIASSWKVGLSKKS
jgi:hypothetical protein